jgi:predicted DNA-binding ArsR family transcriptional regulator
MSPALEPARRPLRAAHTRSGQGAAIDRHAHAVVGAAIEVHRWLGPGFLEGGYEEAPCVELELRGIPFWARAARCAPARFEIDTRQSTAPKEDATMVTEKIKKRVMEGAMKFMASERGQKLMQNPQLMQALSKALELRGKVQSNIDGSLKTIQKALNLATREDLRNLGETLDDLKRKLESLRRQTDELSKSLDKAQGAAAGEAGGWKRNNNK